MEVRTNSPEETQKVAGNLAKTLKKGDVIALFGDLGAGKTVFVQGLARGFGIKRRILSPTFVFMRSYPFTIDNSPLTFYHIDLYRGEDIKDFKTLGLNEIFQEDSIVVLEWAEKIKDKLPNKRIDVTIKAIDEKTRKITVKRPTPNTSGVGFDSPEVEKLNRAARILRSGGVVIFPTDTVYGIGCRFDNKKAIERVRQIKKTPESQHFPILVSDVGQVKKLAKITNAAAKLIEKYWPGGLTIILSVSSPTHPKPGLGKLTRHKPGLGYVDKPGLKPTKIGFRMPDSLLTRTLIEKVGVPIVGTSANFHGKRATNTFKWLDPKFTKLSDYTIIGECKLGIESTVVDATVDPPKVL